MKTNSSDRNRDGEHDHNEQTGTRNTGKKKNREKRNDRMSINAIKKS